MAGPEEGCAWKVPQQFPPLQSREAHVWRCDLDTLGTSNCWSILNRDERERADRFHFSIHRSRFIAARGLLRRLLSAYLDRPAAQVRFDCNAHGKPDLHDRALRFNISHSKNQALFAFTSVHSIGVDLEQERDDFDDEKISRLAERFFGDSEIAALSTLCGGEKRAAFFRCWSRKEALLKATGEGVSGGLKTYQVSVLKNDAARVLSPEGASDSWTLLDLKPGNGFAAALAVCSLEVNALLFDYVFDSDGATQLLVT